MKRSILHADLDAFYASAEQLIDPSLRNRPVLVGGGIVVAASYEARAFGVRAPMSTRDALALCPGAVVVDGHFDRYLELSDRVVLNCHHDPVTKGVRFQLGPIDLSGQAELEARLQAVQQERPDVQVVLRADRRVPYGLIRQAMQAIAKAGLQNMNIAAEVED